ncbi:unnamed protein product [Candida verbasci]|uniref:Uncharacterized protein n=1 Tax=Candida verbasci TaxID=1227364 RepID=A0A9W4TZF0_9ASCO|nr:unnamed protein product [Candida verbasci]
MSTFQSNITPPPQSKRKYIEDDDYISYEEPINQKEQHEILKKNLKDEINHNPEWPQFIHPEGGVIKITPWGSLRQYKDLKTGEVLTKFEDFSFDDFNKSIYESEKYEKIYKYTPDTPMSIKNQNKDIYYSPSTEAESYVIDGYRNNVEFQQEHENYFGMNEYQEEFDISTYQNEDEDENEDKDDDDEMN